MIQTRGPRLEGLTKCMATSVTTELVMENGRRSIHRFLAPLIELANVRGDMLGCFEVGGQKYSLPKFSFSGPNSSDPIRIGLFGSIHGDEPVGALALRQLLIEISREPQLAENFHLEFYPICNPTGFEDNTRHSRRGRDLNRQFWKESSQPEVELLEHQLRHNHFSGLIQLHADDTSDGIYGFVRGHTLTENLLRPALDEAAKVLPRNPRATIDGFAARDGIIYDQYEGVLAAPANMDPVPFEIILETPHSAPIQKQVQALVIATRTILAEYRHLISFAANL